ncbi:hypothetical protein QQ045_027553 [Rhodiola kirilowii]
MANKTMAERIAEARKALFDEIGHQDMSTLNTQVLDTVLHQIKGITASIWAKQLYIICNQMREHVHNGEIERCREAFAQMENQIAVLDQRLGVYFELCRQVQPEGLIDGFPSLSSAGESAAKDGVKGKGM